MLHRTSRPASSLPVLVLTLALLPLCGCPKLHSAPPPSEVRVFAATPGMTSLEAESQAAIPLERLMTSVPQLSRLHSRVSASGVELRLRFAPGSAEDGQGVLEKLRGAGQHGLQAPSVESRRGPIIHRYTVESSQLPGSELRALHERIIRRALVTIPGVRAVTTCGAAPPRVEIVEDLPRMIALGVTPGEVEKAVRDTSLLDGKSAQFGFGGGLSLQQLSRVRVAERAGAPISLNDLAVIRQGAAAPTCLAGRDDRPDVLAAQVWLTSGSDAKAVQKSIAARLAEVGATLPAGVRLQAFPAPANPTRAQKKGWLRRTVEEAFPKLVPSVLRVRLTFPGPMTPPEVRSLSNALRTLAGRLARVDSVWTQAQLATDLETGAAEGELELLMALRPASPGASLTTLTDELLPQIAQLPGAPFEVELSAEDAQGEWPATLSPHPVAVHIHGLEAAPLTEVAQRLRTTLSGSSAVRALRIEGIRQRPQIRLAINRQSLAEQGLSASDVAAALEPAMGGKTIGRILEGEDALALVVLTGEGRELPALLDAMMLKGSRGNLVPMRQLVSVSTELTPSTLYRDSGQRCVRVRMTAPSIDPKKLIESTRESIRTFQLPAGVSLSVEVADD